MPVTVMVVRGRGLGSPRAASKSGLLDGASHQLVTQGLFKIDLIIHDAWIICPQITKFTNLGLLLSTCILASIWTYFM